MWDAASLDLETLGTGPGDVILSIGMALFNSNTGDIGPTFFCSFDEQEWLDAGYTARDSTREWWKHPDRDAARAFLLTERRDMKQGLTEAVDFLRGFGLTGGLWSRGYMDETMLKLAVHKELGIEDPWYYRAPSDARTLLSVIERFDRDGSVFYWNDVEFVGTPHHALDDATHEAKLVSTALQGLSRLFPKFPEDL